MSPTADGTPSYGPPATQLTTIMDAIQDRGVVHRGPRRGVRAQVLPDITEAGITDVVVGPMDHRAQMIAFFTDLLGRGPMSATGSRSGQSGALPRLNRRPRPGHWARPGHESRAHESNGRGACARPADRMSLGSDGAASTAPSLVA